MRAEVCGQFALESPHHCGLKSLGQMIKCLLHSREEPRYCSGDRKCRPAGDDHSGTYFVLNVGDPESSIGRLTAGRNSRVDDVRSLSG